MRRLALLAFASLGLAQESEQRALNEALSAANNSQVEIIRALEGHLAKFPQTAQRADLERALAKAAMETHDNRRIVLYGERVIGRNPDDVQVLESLVRALLALDVTRDISERALKHARRYENMVAGLRQEKAPGRISEATWQDGVERGVANALRFQARATGELGRSDEAVALARKAWETYPSGDAARELGRWLAQTARFDEAIVCYANAFTIPDPRSDDSDRAADRARMGELYRKLHGSEAGLGDLVLQAYDRTSALDQQRRAGMARKDPNVQASKILDFTITALGGEKVPLAGFRGKTLVFDFWATWCGPCRAQHPLYAKVKERFRAKPEVVFLSVSTDEERERVAPFLRENRWEQSVYFEDGLSRAFQIGSIPTTLVVNGRGEIVSRINGFVPELFVDMLTERIEEALAAR